MTKRNASGSWSSWLDLGGDGGDWLGGFEDLRVETQFWSSQSWGIRIEFVSSRRFCFSIWTIMNACGLVC